MEKRYVFQGSEHSKLLEEYTNQKLEKIEELIANFRQPQSIDIHYRAHAVHERHEVDLTLHAADFRLHVQADAYDMYDAVNQSVDKLIVLLKKERDRRRDKTVFRPDKNFSN